MNDHNIKNEKVWLITGASKGLGLALVKLLLSRGVNVAATSRNAVDIENKIQGDKSRLLALTMDVTDESSVQQAVAKTIETFGRLDIVINNAGYMLLGSLEEISAEEFQQSLAVNVAGMVNVIRAAMPYLRQQRSGHVINFSSIAGYRGGGEAGSYHAVKFAVIGLTEALADEVRPFGVKATVIAPGLFRTSFLEQGAYKVAENLIDAYKTGQLADLMQEWNGKQSGDPLKLAEAIIRLTESENPPVHFLAGPDAYQMFTDTRKTEQSEIESWKFLGMSTDFDRHQE